MSNKVQASEPERVIIDLMGHIPSAGQVSEVTKFGKAFMRLDLPGGENTPGFTQWINPDSLYRVTPTTEEIARAIAVKSFTKPAILFDLEHSLQRQLDSRKPDSQHSEYFLDSGKPDSQHSGYFEEEDYE